MHLRFLNDPFFRSLFAPDDGGGFGGGSEPSGGTDGGGGTGEPSDSPSDAPAIDAGKYAEYERFHKEHGQYADKLPQMRGMYERYETLKAANPQAARILDYVQQYGQLPPGYGQRQQQPTPQQQREYKFYREQEDPDKFWEGMRDNPLELFDRGLSSPNFHSAVVRAADNPQFQQKVVQAVIAELDKLPAIQHILKQFTDHDWEQKHGSAYKELEGYNPEVAKLVSRGSGQDPAIILKALKAAGVSPKVANAAAKAVEEAQDDEEPEVEQPRSARRPATNGNGNRVSAIDRIKQMTRTGKL